MKFAYVSLLLLILIQTSSHGLKLSKKVVDLLQEVLEESKESDDESAGELLKLTEDEKVDTIKDEIVDAIEDEKVGTIKDEKVDTIKDVKKHVEHPQKREKQLSRKISNLLQEVMDVSRGNTTLQDDVDEIRDTHLAPKKVPKRDHPNKCAGEAFEKAMDAVAIIMEESIMDKLKEDFLHKFDDGEEEIYKKIRKDASARPWFRRRYK